MQAKRSRALISLALCVMGAMLWLGCLTEQRAQPIDPVSGTEVEHDKIRAKGPGWIERTTGVIDPGQSVSFCNQHESTFVKIQE